MTVSAASVEDAAPDYLEVDVVDPDSGALPLSASAEVDGETAEAAETEVDLEVEYDNEGEAVEDDADQYEYVDDTSGYRSARSRRGPRLRHSTGGIATTRTKPPRSLHASTPSASGC